MKKMILFTIGSIAILFYTCKKPDSNVTKIPVNADLKAAFNFQLGTYWIYIDSASGQVDSFFVRSNTDIYTATTNTTNGTNESVEGISIIISEYNIGGPSIIDTQHWELYYNKTMICAFLNNAKLGQVQYEPLVNYPFQTTLVKTLNSDYQENDIITTIFNNFSLNGQSFVNVAEINNSADINYNLAYLTSPYIYSDWFCICPDIGFIEIKLNHPQDSLYRVWQIKRWSITK